MLLAQLGNPSGLSRCTEHLERPNEAAVSEARNGGEAEEKIECHVKIVEGGGEAQSSQTNRGQIPVGGGYAINYRPSLFACCCDEIQKVVSSAARQHIEPGRN
jgi:hypothetical protein